LLPKINEADRIQQYRCLFNITFKISTKTTIIWLNLVAGHVVRPTQTAFMQKRNILNGVVVLSTKCGIRFGGPRVASWNVLLQRLALVHLMQGMDEF
jgi:hypothetical protein